MVGSSGSCKFEFAAVLFSSLDSEKDLLILNGNFWFLVTAAVTPLIIWFSVEDDNELHCGDEVLVFMAGAAGCLEEI